MTVAETGYYVAAIDFDIYVMLDPNFELKHRLGWARATNELTFSTLHLSVQFLFTFLLLLLTPQFTILSMGLSFMWLV